MRTQLHLGIIFGFIFIASPGFAKASNWKFVDEKVVSETRDASEIVSLSTQYPDLFKGIDLKHTNYVWIDRSTYVYQGASACPSGDPRLQAELFQIATCNDGGICGGLVRSLPEADPCGSN